MYALLLNDMRSSNVENIEIVKMSPDRQFLVDWYESQLGPWKDGRWNKSFQAGSELEWYNDCPNLARENDYWGGIWTVIDSAQVGDGLFRK